MRRTRKNLKRREADRFIKTRDYKVNVVNLTTSLKIKNSTKSDKC